eukprot:m.946831 g.946831  ORF g.946831 m.946831 type:complete len:448 (+) comp23847_c0_seq53:222-1565(+)
MNMYSIQPKSHSGKQQHKVKPEEHSTFLPSPGVLVPPFRFGLVERGLYRSAYPTEKNFPFLTRLGLKSIVTLAQTVHASLENFIQENSITLKHLPVVRSMDTITLTHENVCAVLEWVINPCNFPCLVHCYDGTHTTGLVMMCLRKLQMLDPAFMEAEFERYQRSETVEPVTADEHRMVETFKQHVQIPAQIPTWLWDGIRPDEHPTISISNAPLTDQEDDRAQGGEAFSTEPSRGTPLAGSPSRRPPRASSGAPSNHEASTETTDAAVARHVSRPSQPATSPRKHGAGLVVRSGASAHHDRASTYETTETRTTRFTTGGRHRFAVQMTVASFDSESTGSVSSQGSDVAVVPSAPSTPLRGLPPDSQSSDRSHADTPQLLASSRNNAVSTEQQSGASEQDIVHDDTYSTGTSDDGDLKHSSTGSSSSDGDDESHKSNVSVFGRVQRCC